MSSAIALKFDAQSEQCRMDAGFVVSGAPLVIAWRRAVEVQDTQEKEKA